jgi:hypothetical protein
MAGSNPLSLEERVLVTEQTLSSISQQLRDDASNNYYNRDYMLNTISLTLETVNKPAFVYMFMVRIHETLKREIGNEQGRLLIKDIFETVQAALILHKTAECGSYDDNTMIIVCEEDVSQELKRHVSTVLVEDYPEFKGLSYSVGGTNTVQHDSLTAVIARLEYAIKKTSDQRNEVFILTSK